MLTSCHFDQQVASTFIWDFRFPGFTLLSENKKKINKQCNPGGPTQFPGRLLLDAASISTNCWSSSTPRLLLLLLIIIIAMWWQRCAEHLQQTPLCIPSANRREQGSRTAVSQTACSAISFCLTLFCPFVVALTISSKHLAERPDQVRQGQGVTE